MHAALCLSRAWMMKEPRAHILRLFSTSSNLLKKEAVSTAKGRKMGSTKWLDRQINDPYVKRAREESYRCRSAYKLLEIDDKYGILKPGQNVIDCGAAPGSWTEVAVERTKALGTGS